MPTLMPSLMHWMGELVTAVFRASLWLALLSCLFLPLERLLALHDGVRPWREVAKDLGYFYLNSVLPSFAMAAPLALLGVVSAHVRPAAWDAWIHALPFGLRLSLALLVSELGAYWAHRWAHHSAFLWRFHAVHHAPEQLYWLTNTRAHTVDLVFTKLIALLPVFALGLADVQQGASDAVPLMIVLIGTVWSFFIHANLRLRLGFIEHLVSTPFFHHWHHARGEVVDKNFAALLPLWDGLFGTLHRPANWPVTYGLNQAAPDSNGELAPPQPAL